MPRAQHELSSCSSIDCSGLTEGQINEKFSLPPTSAELTLNTEKGNLFLSRSILAQLIQEEIHQYTEKFFNLHQYLQRIKTPMHGLAPHNLFFLKNKTSVLKHYILQKRNPIF